MKKLLLSIFLRIIFFVHVMDSLSWKNELINKINSGQVDDWIIYQVNKDLSEFKDSGIIEESLDRTCGDDPKSKYLFRFKILDNKISLVSNDFEIINGEVVVKSTGDKETINKLFHPFIFQFPKLLYAMLLDLTESVKIPDLEFIFYSHDGFNPPKNWCPLFAITKSELNGRGIVAIPDFLSYEHSKGIETLISSVAQKYPWENKLNKAFWRGALSDIHIKPYFNAPRYKAVDLSIRYPNLIDARYTSDNYKDYVDIKLSPSYFGNFVSVEAHLKYKYQILVDGTAAPTPRIFWQLFTNSVILKQESDSIQWYYQALKPFIHYIPLENDASNLYEAINWAKDNDSKCKIIIQNANDFANNNLKRSDMLFYFYYLFSEYSKLLKYKINP